MPEQHPIPQQISSYSFKLVGDMTLKQFSQLAAGVLISLALYASPLHPFIKWPLIVLSFLFGIALAFLPIQGRPLSTWLLIFFKSIYSPTYFVWRKDKALKEYFAPEEGLAGAPAVAAAEKKEEVAEHLEPVIKTTPSVEKLEEKEKTFLSKVAQTFIAPGTTVVIAATPIHTYTPTPVLTKENLQIPQVKPLEVEHIISAGNAQTNAKYTTMPEIATTGITSSAASGFLATKAAQFSQDVMPPLPPNRSNIVVGQVLDPEGKIIEGVILEIKDAEGRPVRALKSNKLGHFMIATPLLDGRYQIITEKEGFIFDPIYFDAVDKIIPPIAIWSKATEVSSLKN